MTNMSISLSHTRPIQKGNKHTCHGHLSDMTDASVRIQGELLWTTSLKKHEKERQASSRVQKADIHLYPCATTV